MNKIIVDEEVYVLEDNIRSIDINCDTKLYICNTLSIDLCINLADGVNVSIYDFNISNKLVNIEINQYNNSVVTYYHSFKIDGEYKLNYISNIYGDNNSNNIKVFGISSGNATLNIDGVIKSGTKNNYLDEDIKILTIDGKANVSPMMHINIKECIANHNTAISNVREDEIFYLMSKGISRDLAIKLICEGYLFVLFKDEEKFFELINKLEV